MRTDRELLELAAKAAGEDVEWHVNGSYFYRRSSNWPAEKGFFNPLHDDGEALRLAVKLRIDIEFFNGFDEVRATEYGVTRGETISAEEPYREDISLATRRAITRAAAAIGEKMP